jgi:hypothetical protein
MASFVSGTPDATHLVDGGLVRRASRGHEDACEVALDSLLLVWPGPTLTNDKEVEGIRTALDGVNVLTVSAVADYVPRGIVLGFDLVGGHPKMLIHLTQARRQHVAFMSDVLKLMQVFE